MRKLIVFTIILVSFLPAAAKTSIQYLGTDSTEGRKIHSSEILKIYRTVNTNTHEIIKNDTATVWYLNNILNMPVMTDSLAAVTEYDAKYYKLFVPMTLYHSPLDAISTLNWQMPDFTPKDYVDTSVLPYDSLAFTSYQRANSQVDQTLLHLYLTDYSVVKNTEDHIMSRTLFNENIPVASEKRTEFADLFKSDKAIQEENIKRGKLTSYRPNWWTHGGSMSLQFTQNYVSPNWYKGGESTNTLLSYLSFKANYNDKEKIQWDNLFEAKYGITSSPSDTCHKFLVSNDLLRIYSKLGIQATNRWYYTITGEFNTQFSNAYRKNSNDVLAAFLAPANLIMTIGMDFKFKTKNIDFSLLLSPLAYNMRYVGDRRVNETAYGLDEGKKFLHIYGSKLTSTWTWNFVPTVSWTSRLYYFTNYKGAEAEWENTFNFVLNKFLSAQLFLHGRFDDKVTPPEGQSYFQFKEYLSFGINYAW